MPEKEKLVKVQFWVNESLKAEIDKFAKSIAVSASLVYKAGALLFKNKVQNAPAENLVILTKSWNDFQDSQMRKKIHDELKDNRCIA